MHLCPKPLERILDNGLHHQCVCVVYIEFTPINTFQVCDSNFSINKHSRPTSGKQDLSKQTGKHTRINRENIFTNKMAARSPNKSPPAPPITPEQGPTATSSGIFGALLNDLANDAFNPTNISDILSQLMESESENGYDADDESPANFANKSDEEMLTNNSRPQTPTTPSGHYVVDASGREHMTHFRNGIRLDRERRDSDESSRSDILNGFRIVGPPTRSSTDTDSGPSRGIFFAPHHAPVHGAEGSVSDVLHWHCPRCRRPIFFSQMRQHLAECRRR